MAKKVSVALPGHGYWCEELTGAADSYMTGCELVEMLEQRVQLVIALWL